jgi:hypothetical protein
MPHGPPTARVVLTSEEGETLVRWARRRSTAQALALRARIVLACAGPRTSRMACSPRVRRAPGHGRRPAAARRLAGLKDDPRVGTPRRISDADVERAIATTLEQMRPDGTHWDSPLASTRGLAQARPGQPERHTHDDVRHGTRNLFAALGVKAGTVTGEAHAGHRSEEFRHVLDTVDATTPPELGPHLMLDNAPTHKTT